MANIKSVKMQYNQKPSPFGKVMTFDLQDGTVTGYDGQAVLFLEDVPSDAQFAAMSDKQNETWKASLSYPASLHGTRTIAFVNSAIAALGAAKTPDEKKVARAIVNTLTDTVLQLTEKGMSLRGQLYTALKDSKDAESLAYYKATFEKENARRGSYVSKKAGTVAKSDF